MQKEITLTIPTDWDGVSLNKYLNLQKELKNYEDDDEAKFAVLLTVLCDLPGEYIKGLSITDYNDLKIELTSFLGKTEYPLQRIVKWKGKEYGFEPNLSQIAYGAYLDIAKHDSLTIDEKWAKVMNILYREIDTNVMGSYTIKPYNTTIDNSNEMLEWGMDIHFGAYFFFTLLLTDLVNSIPNFSREVVKYPHLLQTLRRSGATISQLLNWPTATLPNLPK